MDLPSGNGMANRTRSGAQSNPDQETDWGSRLAFSAVALGFAPDGTASLSSAALIVVNWRAPAS